MIRAPQQQWNQPQQFPQNVPDKSQMYTPNPVYQQNPLPNMPSPGSQGPYSPKPRGGGWGNMVGRSPWTGSPYRQQPMYPQEKELQPIPEDQRFVQQKEIPWQWAMENRLRMGDYSGLPMHDRTQQYVQDLRNRRAEFVDRSNLPDAFKQWYDRFQARQGGGWPQLQQPAPVNPAPQNFLTSMAQTYPDNFQLQRMNQVFNRPGGWGGASLQQQPAPNTWSTALLSPY